MIEELVRLPDTDAVPQPRLEGRVVLVTGATGGLGEALTAALARTGAQLILAGRQVVKLDRLADVVEGTGGPGPILYPVDLAGATAGDYAEMAAAIDRECGRLDGIVHAAARFKGLSPLVHASYESWTEAMTVNLSARFLIDQATHGLLRARRGRIVHVLDDLGQVGRAYWGAYGVSQFALRGLLAILGDEFEEDGITLAGFLPGPVRTRLRASAWISEEDRSAADPADVVGGILQLLDPAFAPAAGTVYRLPERP